MSRASLALCCLVALPLAAGAEARPRTRMLVMESRADRGVDAALARLLDEVLLTELSRRTSHEVIGGSDLQRLLALTATKQKFGCEADDCLAEIGGALGAELLAAPSLGRVGTSFVVNLKVIDVKLARVDRRWSETVPATEDALESAVRRSVAALYPETSSRPAGWVSLGVAAAAAGTGGYFLRAALQAADRRNRATDNAAWAVAQGDAERDGKIANVAFGVAAVATLGAVLLFSR